MIYWKKNEINKSKYCLSSTMSGSKLRCKICLEFFNLEMIKRHVQFCKEKAQFLQEIRNLKLEFKKFEIIAKELIRKLHVEMTLEK